VFGNTAIDRDQLLARLDKIKSRTRICIEHSIRLIDESFLRFKATHRNLYAAQRAQELLNALPKTRSSGARFRGLLENTARNRQRPVSLHAEISSPAATCDHCEGIILNKAYRLRTHDGGLVLLDMIVCYACNLEARNLGLNTHELKSSTSEPELTPLNEQVLD
jgi:hypothetical protein